VIYTQWGAENLFKGSEKIWEEGLGDLGQGIGEHAKNDSQRGLMGRGSIKGIKRVH